MCARAPPRHPRIRIVHTHTDMLASHTFMLACVCTLPSHSRALSSSAVICPNVALIIAVHRRKVHAARARSLCIISPRSCDRRPVWPVSKTSGNCVISASVRSPHALLIYYSSFGNSFAINTIKLSNVQPLPLPVERDTASRRRIPLDFCGTAACVSVRENAANAR